MVSDRVLKIEQDEDNPDSRVVHSLGKLNIKVEAEKPFDPFGAPAKELKSLSGVDPMLKRKVTNELKKLNQNSDGTASSNKIEDEYSGYDAFGVVTPPYNLDYLAKLYEISAPHHAAVEAKIANIVGLGFKFVETNKTKRLLEDQQGNEKKLKKTRRTLDSHRDDLIDLFESFNEEDSFTEVLTKVWRDYETMGNGFIEIGRKLDGTIGYVGHIPAQTMRVRRQRDGYVQLSGEKMRFFSNFKNINEEVSTFNPVGNDKPNEIIHILKATPVNSYYGIPDILAAQQAIAGNEFIARFNLDYFENKAIPRHLIILKGATLGTSSQSDLLEFFETNLKGQNHRSLFVPLPGGTKEEPVEFTIEPIEAGVQDASFLNLRKMNDGDILSVHRVPRTKISVDQGTNLAVARDADKTFKEQVCGPEQKMLEKKVHRITTEFTDAFVFQLVQMTLTDEDTQSKIDERRRKTGVETANEQRIRRGDPAVPGGDELVDLNAAAKIAEQKSEDMANRERDSARSASATDSNGEGRNTKGDGRAQS